MPADRGLRTVVLGFGRIAAGYANDSRMRRWFPYATHAQVLRQHPAFRWTAVVDPDPAGRAEAEGAWGVTEAVAAVADLASPDDFEVAVIATPPDVRIDLIEQLPRLRAVMVEKPLGEHVEDAHRFLDICANRGIQVQVNFPRRGDEAMQTWVADLSGELGDVQAVFATYGNGLANNGSHLIDWIRMFLGEIVSARVVTEGPIINEAPSPGDTNLPFVLGLASGACVMVQPLRFSNYREVGLDIWGAAGRLSFWQEGLIVAHAARTQHRFLDAHFEVASDSPHVAVTGQGEAIYRLYDNLALALAGKASLWSPGDQALRVMAVIEAVLHSRDRGGELVKL